ncbi:MAG: BRCT domain-containing protein, partial [Myxococcota bacterium]
MILKLKGSTFAVTGTLTHFTRATAHEAIVRGGGTVTKSVTSKTRALIAGGSAGAKIDQARSRGALILDEEQFQKLLRDGEIEVVEDGDKPVEETISFRDAIAELRGALDGHPTSDK